MNLSRRNFLQRSAAMSAVGLSLGAITRASAQGATDYKALVCLFLSGGNDAFNTVLAEAAGTGAVPGAISAMPVLPSVGRRAAR